MFSLWRSSQTKRLSQIVIRNSSSEQNKRIFSFQKSWTGISSAEKEVEEIELSYIVCAPTPDRSLNSVTADDQNSAYHDKNISVNVSRRRGISQRLCPCGEFHVYADDLLPFPT
ncbi:hypothetical protein CEXT_728441 [Caerostris extrusa]|uniref:Uncharacterized protein n=1 Tax=Caerostris extrusa TaxID=172846 RepID=A0AAV4XQ88_CAEEX|nr:hypothetical protein CEXT_728441 [Caerostris extrusa]